ncbi:unnamed protein product [Parnassius mnemosyne]|uniref:Uncharacterized protein n=1 Tax=Parnassius mnemosyne TaxID=213953 RepID=A0AAV1KB44_9NEOP
MDFCTSRSTFSYFTESEILLNEMPPFSGALEELSVEMPSDDNSPITIFTVKLQNATHSTTNVDSELHINSDQFNKTIPATSKAESEKDYDIIMESEQPDLTTNVDSNKDSIPGDLLVVEPPCPHPRPITHCSEPEIQHCTPTKSTLSGVLGVSTVPF